MEYPRSYPKIRHRLINALHDMDIIGIRALAYYLPSILFPKANGELIIHTQNGLDLLIDPNNDSGVERRLYRTGIYEKGTLQLLTTLLRPGSVFVDVGANIGSMTLHASKVVGAKGRVIAYEPQPRTAEILEYNIHLNNARNVILRRKAVGSFPGTAIIHDHPSRNRGRASLIAPEKGTSSIGVDVVRLDEDLRDSRPDVVKIDVEGYEKEVLQGMSGLFDRQIFPILILEWSQERTSSDGQGTRMLKDYLDQWGRYRYFKLSKGKERSSKLIQITGPKDFPLHDNVVCIASEQIPRSRPSLSI